jgi:hypothetical protein
LQKCIDSCGLRRPVRDTTGDTQDKGPEDAANRNYKIILNLGVLEMARNT